MIPDTIDRHEWNSLDPNVTFHEWGELRRKNELLIAACKAAEQRYRTMWFGIRTTPKATNNTRGEWEMLKAALAAARSRSREGT